MLDISAHEIKLTKIKFQNRVYQNIILVRLDLDGGPHRNPDVEDVVCPHIHIYKEGYGDKWAYPLPSNFTDPSNIFKTLDEFMNYCNIKQKPVFQQGVQSY